MTRLRLVAAGLITVLVLGFLGWTYARDGIGAILAGLAPMGPWGPVLITAAYIPTCVLMLPGWPLSLGAGYLFGVVRGTLAVSVGSTLGAAAAFAIARYAIRETLRERMKGHARFRALDRVTAERGPQVVVLARLSPVLPFNLLNYALGLTSVSGPAYVVASWLGMLPATIVYVYAGATARDLTEALEGQARKDTGGLPLLVVGLAATAMLLWLLVRSARRNLDDILREEALDSARDHDAFSARLGETTQKL